MGYSGEEALEKMLAVMCKEAWVLARIEPQKPDQTFNRSREFQREVLAYLKEHGPQPYDALYLHFDSNRTPEVEAVFRELIQWKFIERGSDPSMMVSITASGIARLGFKDIWKGYSLIRLSAGNDKLGWTSNEDIARIEANLEVIETSDWSIQGFEVMEKSDGPSDMYLPWWIVPRTLPRKDSWAW
jgi:hypothetical protein